MQTKAKSNSIITHALATLLGRPAVTFKFRGNDIGRLEFSKMSAATLERAALHGMLQRIGDGGAFERTAPDGSFRDDAEMDRLKKVRITRLIDHYNSGTEDWDLVRAAGSAPDNTGLTIEAIARVYFKGDTEETERKVTALAEKKGISRKEMLGTYANIPDVASMIGTIKAERAARGGIDSAALTDELMSA